VAQNFVPCTRVFYLRHILKPEQIPHLLTDVPQIALNGDTAIELQNGVPPGALERFELTTLPCRDSLRGRGGGEIRGDPPREEPATSPQLRRAPPLAQEGSLTEGGSLAAEVLTFPLFFHQVIASRCRVFACGGYPSSVPPAPHPRLFRPTPFPPPTPIPSAHRAGSTRLEVGKWERQGWRAWNEDGDEAVCPSQAQDRAHPSGPSH